MKKLLLAAVLCLAAFVVAPVASANAAQFVGACLIHGKATFGKGAGKYTGAKLPVSGNEMLNYQFKSGPIKVEEVEVDPTVCAHLNLTEAEELAADLAAEPVGEPEPENDSKDDVLAAVLSHTMVKAEAEVKGGGELGCAKAAGGYGMELLPAFNETLGPGTGEIKVGGVKAAFGGFKFISTGTQVHFVAGELGDTDAPSAAGEASFAADAAGVAACKPTSPEGPGELEFSAVTAGVIGS